MQMILNYTLNK